MKILIIGGNKFFGKKLAQLLVRAHHQVTLLNRGNTDDGLGNSVERIFCDRNDFKKLTKELAHKTWDVVVDQICYDYQTAKKACDLFKDKTNHYIFTSSQSVYEAGAALKEDDFNPKQHIFEQEETAASNYAEAKRQAEVAFTKYAPFKTTFVRFPIVIGEDDYTERLKFHVDRIQNGSEIFFPDINARISFISALDAGRSLKYICEQTITGPFNCCANGSIKLSELIYEIETATGKKLQMADHRSEENMSPYGIDRDWYMSNDNLIRAGLFVDDIIDSVREAINLLV